MVLRPRVQLFSRSRMMNGTDFPPNTLEKRIFYTVLRPRVRFFSRINRTMFHTIFPRIARIRIIINTHSAEKDFYTVLRTNFRTKKVELWAIVHTVFPRMRHPGTHCTEMLTVLRPEVRFSCIGSEGNLYRVVCVRSGGKFARSRHALCEKSCSRSNISYKTTLCLITLIIALNC